MSTTFDTLFAIISNTDDGDLTAEEAGQLVVILTTHQRRTSDIFDITANLLLNASAFLAPQEEELTHKRASEAVFRIYEATKDAMDNPEIGEKLKALRNNVTFESTKAQNDE